MIIQKTKKRILFVNLLLVVTLFFSFEAEAGWTFWERKDSCVKLANDMIHGGLYGLRNENMEKVKSGCYNIILKTGDYKELYAYYGVYKYIDDIYNKYNKHNLKEDKAPNNIYHYMLFYANQNSREFNSKTNSFNNEKGLYEQELKDFEDNMTQEEKIKAFSYIADNLATGKEGWVRVNDYKKSFEYLKKAAEAGDVKSQAAIGYSFFSGLDWMSKFEIEKNYVIGYNWLYLSTVHSTQRNYFHKQKVNDLKILVKKFRMSDYDIQKSKNLSKIWLKENSEFIKNHPLTLIEISKEEIATEKIKTEKFIKDYGLDKTLLNNNVNLNN